METGRVQRQDGAGSVSAGAGVGAGAKAKGPGAATGARARTGTGEKKSFKALLRAGMGAAGREDGGEAARGAGAMAGHAGMLAVREEREGGSGGGSGSESGSGSEGGRVSGGESESEGESETESGSERERLGESDWCDGAARMMAQMAPPVGMRGVGTEPAAGVMRGRSLEELLPALVRRIAWGGDRHKGSVRLELGAGSYAGTTVVVHADGGRVRVEIGGAEGPALDRLRARVDARLRGHGLDVESVT